MIITSFWSVDILLIFAAITFALYKYSTRKYDYFKKRKIHYVKPIPFFGSMFLVVTFKKTVGEWLKELYNATDKPYFGIFVFDEPYIVIRSPEMIKDVLVRNFNKFSDRNILAPKHNDIISSLLFMQKNPRWKTARTKTAPIFSSSKLKGMFATINRVGEELNDYIENNLGILEMKDVASKYSGEVIARCAFAINAHSFENVHSEFKEVGKSLLDFTWRNGFAQSSYFFKQNLASGLRLEFFPKWAVNFLKSTFWNAIETREQTNIKRNDLIDIIIEMRKDKDLCNEMDFEGDKVVAQAVEFFAAGYESSSSTISFTLYELSIQPEVQDKLRNEIMRNVKLHGITYDSLKQMNYLEMCIYETLRKYPVLPFLDRRCNEDHQLAGSNLLIEKGMPVYIPLLGLHYDESFFPDPEKYDPERFAEGHPYNANGLQFLPFGGGPRSCIGQRFGMLGVKTALVHILSKFAVEKAPETPVPVQFATKTLVLQSTIGLPSKFKKLNPQSSNPL